jgi:GH25 family lysozyme M1 (1,4-beta-N-acetylmuramidase)
MLTPTGHFADVSHYDDANLDLHAYVNVGGCKLIILKASEGNWADPTFARMSAQVRSMPGLTLGTYVYEDDAPEAGQIGAYLSTAHLQSGDLQPVVDAEALGLTRAETFAALEDLEHRGYAPILYCNKYFFVSVLGSPTRWRLWLADYTGALPALPDGVSLFAWQHTQNNSCPGIPAPCDMSYLFAPSGDITPFLIP